MKLTVTLSTPSGDVVLSSPEIPDDAEARLQAAAQYFDVIGPRLLNVLEVARSEPAPAVDEEDPALPELPEPPHMPRPRTEDDDAEALPEAAAEDDTK